MRNYNNQHRDTRIRLLVFASAVHLPWRTSRKYASHDDIIHLLQLGNVTTIRIAQSADVKLNGSAQHQLHEGDVLLLEIREIAELGADHQLVHLSVIACLKLAAARNETLIVTSRLAGNTTKFIDQSHPGIITSVDPHLLVDDPRTLTHFRNAADIRAHPCPSIVHLSQNVVNVHLHHRGTTGITDSLLFIARVQT